MLARTRKFLVTTCVSVMMMGAIGAPASAQVEQDGLVNVNIGDITIEDVNVGVAAAIAANVCGVRVGPVAVLAVQVDRSGETETVCEIDDQTVTLEQN